MKSYHQKLYHCLNNRYCNFPIHHQYSYHLIQLLWHTNFVCTQLKYKSHKVLLWNWTEIHKESLILVHPPSGIHLLNLCQFRWNWLQKFSCNIISIFSKNERKIKCTTYFTDFFYFYLPSNRSTPWPFVRT